MKNGSSFQKLVMKIQNKFIIYFSQFFIFFDINNWLAFINFKLINRFHAPNTHFHTSTQYLSRLNL